MPLIQLPPDDNSPRYLQIVRAVKQMLAMGRFQPGDELPAIRVLANQLTINPNTVARAYRELEQEGVVVKRQTTGTFISERGCTLPHAEKMRILTAPVDQILIEARRLEVDLDQLMALIRERDQALSPPRQETPES